MASQDARLSKFEADFKQQQSKTTNKIDTVLKAITDRITGALSSDTVKNPKLNVNSTSPVLSARSYPTEDPQCSTRIHRDDGDIMFIEIIKMYDDSREEGPGVDVNAETGETGVEYFDIFLTRIELAYHKLGRWLVTDIKSRDPTNRLKAKKQELHALIVKWICSVHECDSKTCLAVLKKQFDTFFDLKSSLSSSYQYQSELARQKEIFQEYAHYTYQSLKETILSYLNAIEKMIDERACHEEELQITEKDVKDKQEKLEMEKQETMIQKSEYSSPGDNSDAKREKQEKKENCSKTFQELKMVVLVINPRQLFAKESEFAFELSRVENHEGDSKTYLIELRKQCEAFLTNGNPKSLEISMFSYYMEVFQRYTLYDIKSTKNMIVSCLNAIEKEIDARAHHEDKLARVYDSRVNERTT
ncbi:hypothetical protein Tco_0116061 [Tanacetum coccineum]